MIPHSAYQGKGWKPRKLTSRAEFNGRVWADLRTNSECEALKAVVLYIPGPELDQIARPAAVQHLRPINRLKLAREMRALARIYRKLGVQVFLLDPKRVNESARNSIPPNLVFLRDLFFNTPEGALLARMASSVRAGEEKFAAAELSARSIPICASIGGSGTFEGADALWVDRKTVLLGLGNRTNQAAAKKVRAELAAIGVRTITITLPKGIQHLLGVVQVVDRKLAVVRSRKAPAVARKMKALGFKTIAVNETVEICERQAMNFVCLRPREILMAKHCPETRALLERSGIKVRAEAEISQLINAAGGIACATGILARSRYDD